ncbi:hypothetical protein G6F46_014509 [Rhizopus delemar]|nr:hypothetical protein G6F46_014509 [Rhizopus delemar]
MGAGPKPSPAADPGRCRLRAHDVAGLRPERDLYRDHHQRVRCCRRRQPERDDHGGAWRHLRHQCAAGIHGGRRQHHHQQRHDECPGRTLRRFARGHGGLRQQQHADQQRFHCGLGRVGTGHLGA